MLSCVSAKHKENQPKRKMRPFLKIAVGLLLFVQVFHLASSQQSTDSPGRTIDKDWLRLINPAGGSNAADDATTMDASSGISSGLMAINSEEEQNLIGETMGLNETADVLSVNITNLDVNATTNQPEFPSTTLSPNTTTLPRNSSQSNVTTGDSTTTIFTNQTTSQPTTLAPMRNATQVSTTKPQNDTGLANSTGSTNPTTTVNTVAPDTPITSSSTTVFPSETTETSTVTMATTAVNTPVKANKTDKGAASGSSSERGTAAVSGVTDSDAQFSVQKRSLCVFLAV